MSRNTGSKSPNHSFKSILAATLSNHVKADQRFSCLRDKLKRQTQFKPKKPKSPGSHCSPSTYHFFPHTTNWRENKQQPSPENYASKSADALNKKTMSGASRRLSIQEYKERRQSNVKNVNHGTWLSNSNRGENSCIPGLSDDVSRNELSGPHSKGATGTSSPSTLPGKLFYGRKSHRTTSDMNHSFRKRSNGGGRGSDRFKKPPIEPEVLTLSSSDEEETPLECEPVRDPDYKVLCEKEPHFSSYDGDDNTKASTAFQGNHECFLLRTRVIRIGSYKYLPEDEDVVVLLRDSFKMSLPPIDDGDLVGIVIPIVDIVKILGCFSRNEPLLLLYVKPKIAANIRRHLKMQDEKGPYIDPLSNDQSLRRIALVLKKMEESAKEPIKKYFCAKSSSKLPFEELTEDEAEKILLYSSCSSVQNIVRGTDQSESNSSKTILIYPSPPSKGRITISVDDYLCLAEEQFINDVIIDFYLKWLLLGKLSEIHRQHTHVFSTFFYKRLTFKPKKTRKKTSSFDENPQLSNAERRHSRVQSWSKGVDIFDKDFIIVPINEKSHWYLAMICFPGLDPPEQIPESLSQKTHSMHMRPHRKRNRSQPTSIDPDWSDRDEAEGDDDELEDCDDDQEPLGKKAKVEIIPSITPEEESPSKPTSIKQPCILIFDSIAGSSRSRVVATLREYLTVEHEKRKGFTRTFDRYTMPGHCPKVPQQNNYSDCGLYMLQYAESFFETPLKDYSLPMPTLSDWFDVDVVQRKRDSIAKLIRGLMKNENPGLDITLPELNAKTNSQDNKSKDQDSPFSSPGRNNMNSPGRNNTNSPARSSQESSSNLEIGEFKPITDLNPFQGKQINFKVSEKNLTQKKPRSEDQPVESSKPPSSPVHQEPKAADVVDKETAEKHAALKSLAFFYNSDDSDDEIFVTNEKKESTSSGSIASDLDIFLDKTYSKFNESKDDEEVI